MFPKKKNFPKIFIIILFFILFITIFNIFSTNYLNYQKATPLSKKLSPNLQATNSITGLVAIFRNVYPWNSNSTETILSEHKIPFDVYSSAQMGVVDLSSYQKVIIESDQDQKFYNMLGSHITWFENYSAKGGILEIHACDQGWKGGSWEGHYLMPGGINQTHCSINLISINLPGHPICNEPNSITDAELDGWSSSAHGYFVTYPANAQKLLLDANTLNPVCVEINFGHGVILASMQTLEYGYSQGKSRLLENIVLYCPPRIVAILNATEAPSYWTGGWHNNYTTLYNGLISAGINTIIVRNTDIINGVLENVSLLILIDNVPNKVASSIVKNWALSGGAILSFDSSICFLNWAGILPPESESNNGYNTYWDYSSDANGVVVDATHPIMAGYSYGATIIGTSSDAQYYSDCIRSSSVGPYYTALVKGSFGSNYDYIAALDPPEGGRVVQIWDCRHWGESTNHKLILNAIAWAMVTSYVNGSGGSGNPDSNKPLNAAIIVFIVLGIVSTIGISSAVYKHYIRHQRAPTIIQPQQPQAPNQVSIQGIKTVSPKATPQKHVYGLPTFVICVYCQSKNGMNDLFCQNCGSEL
jgi:hypothetical protein